MPPTLRRRNAVDEQGGSTVERAAQASHSDNTTMLEARLSGNDGPEDEGDDIDSGTKKVKKTRAQFSFEHCHSILVAVLKHRPHAAEFGALGKTWDLVCDEVNREHGTEWRKDVIRKKSQELLDTHRLGNRSAWKSKHISMDDEQHQLLASLLDAWQGECEAIDAENASRAQARDKVAQQRIDDDNESRDLAMQTLGETRSANCAEQDQERSADSEEDENDLESSPSRPKRYPHTIKNAHRRSAPYSTSHRNQRETQNTTLKEASATLITALQQSKDGVQSELVHTQREFLAFEKVKHAEDLDFEKLKHSENMQRLVRVDNLREREVVAREREVVAKEQMLKILEQNPSLAPLFSNGNIDL